MRNRFGGGMTGTRSLVVLVVVLSAFVALYGALVLPRASTTAREAAPDDAPLAVLASSRDAERGDGCSRNAEDEMTDGGITLSPVAY